MKKYILTILTTMLISGISIFAQITVPGQFNIQFTVNECFPKNIYPLQQDAEDVILYKALGFDFCTGSCPFPPHNSCTAQLMNTNDVMTESPNEWCFNGNMIFKWKCQNITTGGGNTGVEPGVFGAATFTSAVGMQPYVQGIYPNPTQGHGELVLQLTEDHSNVALTIHNVMGQLVSEKKILDLDKTKVNIPFDLLKNEQGIYFISVYVNEKMVDHIRLLIQR